VIELDPPSTGPAGAPVATAPRHLEKALLVGFVLGLASVGYFAIGHVSHGTTRTLRTPLDDAIPFVPACMWLYAWVYTAMFYPAFVVRCPFLFRRGVAAYLVVLAVSMASWVVLPVTSAPLRADLSGLDLGWFHNWGMRLNYTLDPPFNCFPSLHMSIAVLAALIAGRARRTWGLVAIPPALGIAVAILTVKQHWVADGVAGALLGWATWWWVVRPARTDGRSEDDLAFDARGPALYLAFHCAVYLALYSAYMAGVRPWER
jgi:membrane-associated phospholipid phosphatase